MATEKSWTETSLYALTYVFHMYHTQNFCVRVVYNSVRGKKVYVQGIYVKNVGKEQIIVKECHLCV